jgi:glycosyltransferase involved in cell wall biosynthesis
MMPRVSLVIPAWNEAEAIGAVLDEVPESLFDEILVVIGDQHDPTGTIAAAHRAQVLMQRARGYGAACSTGVEYAISHGAEIIAFLDGDYADPPGELPRIVAPIQRNEADLVLGCRDLRLNPTALPAHARAGNALVLRILNLLLATNFRDLPSCKAIRSTRLQELRMQEMTYGWTVEMLVKAARQQLRIQQVDVPYRPRRGGRSKVAGNARASVLAAYKLLSCAVGYAT